MKKIMIILALNSLMLLGTPAKQNVNITLSYEGGQIYNNSKWGIENSTLQRYNKEFKTNWKLNNLKKWQAETIALEYYYHDRLEYLNPLVSLQIFDFVFNSGENAYKYINKAFGLKGNTLSLELVNEIMKVNKKIAINKIYNARLQYLKSLKKWKKYGNGWLFRVNNIKEGREKIDG